MAELNTTPLKAKENADKSKYFNRTVEHFDVTKNPGIVGVVDAMQHMALFNDLIDRAHEIRGRGVLRPRTLRDSKTLSVSL